ncbi:MAG: acyltransferase family protein, partial [Nocardioidaceae bacterium]
MGEDLPRAHRPQLDGVRAIAVALVVVFHLGFTWLPGGFTGVDVFFVLSGYLISGLLLTEAVRDGRIRLVRFYARRARRLLPAAVATVIFTVIVDKYLSSPIDYPHLRRHATSAVLYFANWDSATLKTGYFAVDTQLSPLAHFWSLAVEEQFYFIWPAVVVFGLWLARVLRCRVDQLLLIVFAAITATGIAATLLLTGTTAAYYGTHTRAFELSAGGLLAIAMYRRAQRPDNVDERGLANRLTFLGTATCVALALSIDGGTNYPGWAAVGVTTAAILLIAGADLSNTSAAARALGNPLFSWVGRLSYSIYLWHWPLIVFFADDLSRPVLVAVILAAAQASYTLIEQPLRLRTLPRAPHFAVVTSGISASALLGLVLIPWYLHVTPAQQALIDELAHTAVKVHCLAGPGHEARHLSCVLHVGDGATVALVGDSHAEMWIPALTRLAERRDWTLIKTTHPGCPVNDLHQAVQGRELVCAPWRAEAFPELIATFDPDYVILATRSYQMPLYGGTDDDIQPGTSQHVSAWGQAWDKTLDSLSAGGAEIGVMQVQPTLPQGVLACLAEHPDDSAACDFPLSADAALPSYTSEMRDVVA